MTTLERIREERPDIAITVSWEYVEYFSWDGDGEDPIMDGYLPYNVIVTASKIINGKLIQGIAYLGGCYSKDGGKDDPEIGGYLPQMIQEAIEEVDM
jgi:hypothetical protein